MIGAIAGGIAGASAATNSTFYGRGGIFSRKDPDLPKSKYADIHLEAGSRFLSIRVISPYWGMRFYRLAERISFYIDEINLRIRERGVKAQVEAYGFQRPLFMEYVEHINLRPPYLDEEFNTTVGITFSLRLVADNGEKDIVTRLFSSSVHDLAGFMWPNTESHPWAESDSNEVRCINEWKDAQKTVLLERSLRSLERFIRDEGPNGLGNLLTRMGEGGEWFEVWKEETEKEERP